MPKLSYYRNKADKLIQEWGRKTYKKCLVCGNPISCLHHYYPKSTSSALRYDEDNLIPICQGCHFRHHNGDPTIQNKINEIKGNEWLMRLKNKKEQIIKVNVQYYKEVIKRYSHEEV